MSRPMIPKSLAAQIKRAQSAVKDKRQHITHQEREAGKLGERATALYEKFISGNLSDHAYDLQIESIRRKQARESQRGPERYAELDALDVALAALEIEVLQKVAVMRPSKGRVRWPSPLPPFEETARTYAAALDEVDRVSRQKHEHMMARFAEQDEKARIAMERAWTKLAQSLAKAVKRGAMTEDAALTFIRNL